LLLPYPDQSFSREGDDLDRRIRAYCAEWGLNPDAAGDYASAALAILEYERPPSLNERACACAEPPAGLRSGNKDFSVSLAEPRKAEYTVSMNSTPNGSGCAECGRRADGGSNSSSNGSSRTLKSNHSSALPITPF